MLNRKRRAQIRILWRWVVNFWRALILGKDHVLPVVSVFYLTYLCNASCRFCSQRELLKVRHDEPLSMADIRVVLLRLFKISPALYITGGEPTLHRNIVPILELAREIGFYPIVVSTNGLHLRNVPGILHLANRTIVSIHSNSARENARILGVRHNQMLRALLYLADARKEAVNNGNRLQVNCVLTTENIKTAAQVLRFCLKLRLPLFVVPSIVNNQPELASASEEDKLAYSKLIILLVKVKRRAPWLIANTEGYLRRIQNFGDFKCRPLFTLAVNPDGTVKNPCPIKYPNTPEPLGSLLDEEALPLLQQQLDFKRRFVPCNRNCCKACYVEPVLALEHPFSAIRAFVR